jgi:hypothetical protein
MIDTEKKLGEAIIDYITVEKENLATSYIGNYQIELDRVLDSIAAFCRHYLNKNKQGKGEDSHG